MTKVNFISFWLLLSVSMTAIVFNSCSEDNTPAPIDVTYVELRPSTLSLLVGTTGDYLWATVHPSNADDKTVIWTSDDESKVTVTVDGKITAISAGTAIITAKAGNQTATCIVEVFEENVIINGVKWATRNTHNGYFARTPEDTSGPYQWNRIGDGSIYLHYPEEYQNSNSWLPVNDPSPAGYRVPTLEEMQSLLDTAYVTSSWIIMKNNVRARKFTDKATGNFIVLPADGRCLPQGVPPDCSSRNLFDPYTPRYANEGYYWTSSGITGPGAESITHAHMLYFTSNVCRISRDRKDNQLSVRPVAK